MCTLNYVENHVRFENEEENSHGLWRKSEDMMPVKIV